MKIVDKGVMPDGTKIQIEDWSMDYDSQTYGSTVAAYPVATETTYLPSGIQYPKKGKTFRLDLEFGSNEETKAAFDELQAGRKDLVDYKENAYNRKLYESLGYSGKDIYPDRIIEIYQINHDRDRNQMMFESYHMASPIDSTIYDLIWRGPVAGTANLEDIYYKFNMAHPADFRGHSLSMSDIVYFTDDKSAFYVDRFGYKDVTSEFDRNITGPHKDEDKLIAAMSAAGYHYDDIESSQDQLRFELPGMGTTYFGGWKEVENWLNYVTFDDPAVQEKIDHILSGSAEPDQKKPEKKSWLETLKNQNSAEDKEDRRWP